MIHAIMIMTSFAIGLPLADKMERSEFWYSIAIRQNLTHFRFPLSSNILKRFENDILSHFHLLFLTFWVELINIRFFTGLLGGQRSHKFLRLYVPELFKCAALYSEQWENKWEIGGEESLWCCGNLAFSNGCHRNGKRWGSIWTQYWNWLFIIDWRRTYVTE